jgi:predicted O-methyltransferase YrrM
MLNLKKNIYKYLSNISFKFGYDLVRHTYDSPVPDLNFLNENIWINRSEMVGVNINQDNQLKLLEIFVDKYKEEYCEIPNYKTQNKEEYFIHNGAFDSVDGEILYCMIREFKPKIMIEIGSGNSTLLALKALNKNQELSNEQFEFNAIEPYPSELLKNGIIGLTKLCSEFVQNLPLDFFLKLQENDILFIDSSHVLKTGSDVKFEILEVLPRLRKGVIIHFHDILLPAEYHKKWILDEKWFWNEQYILQAFLAFNNSFEVLWSGSYMHLNLPDKLKEAFESYDKSKIWPGSFWIRKIE